MNSSARMPRCILWIAALTLTAFVFQLPAATRNQQIEKLDHQISVLKKEISTHTQQSERANQALLATEKQIGQSIQHLEVLKKTRTDHLLQLKTLQSRLHALKQQLAAQQSQLAKQLQLRYIMQHEEPLVIRLMQDNPSKTHQLFGLYEYLLQTHHQTISALKVTQTELAKNEDALKHQIEIKASLEKQIRTEQKILQDNKQYHQSVLNTLHQRIRTQAETLAEFKRNRRGLTRLLSSLTSEKPEQKPTPLNLAYHRLHYPLSVSKNQIEKKAHGVLFKAQQGTTVRAVASGRVVFSDWLKGYGLLIILDHGNGLMSLYAHNQTLLKDKNQRVANGDPISSVGHTGGIRENGLYFELRQHGKVVSPNKWLS